eukprot:TRINITY_DN8346_c0_g1_i1.p1 TRINITY_DN8346_c0_g1~~TRINITY_DN8346_c0_g1_i1.p1  ORF type:complete len:229 (+),score=27.47 TRINITY_DN8346_c0_g1_i1:40-726(+)
MSVCQGCTPIGHSMKEAQEIFRFTRQCRKKVAKMQKESDRGVSYRHVVKWMKWVVINQKVKELLGRSCVLIRSNAMHRWQAWAAQSKQREMMKAWMRRRAMPPIRCPSRSMSVSTECPSRSTSASTSPPPTCISSLSEPAAFTYYRDRLHSFYCHYNPSKLPSVVPTLKLFVNQEEPMIERLVASYGPEPPPVFSTPLPAGWTEIESEQGDLWYANEDRKQWHRPVDL